MENKIIDLSHKESPTTSELNYSYENKPREICQDFRNTVGNESFLMSFSASIASNDNNNSIDMKDSENFNNFSLNKQLWNTEKRFDSYNNYDSGYFDEIVRMGEAAVPYILEELKKGPTQLVHALDIIYPGKVKYEGFVPLKMVCDTWISILSKTENN